jgi:hypothetical protein
MSRQTHYDNGVMRLEGFIAGVRDRMILLDNPGSLTGATNWTSIVTRYDAQGKNLSRITDYDNGTRRIETFDQGVRVQVDLMDNPTRNYNGVYNWDTITKTFDASGKLTGLHTVLDNDVVKVEHFAEGSLAERIETDAANVFDWSTINSQFHNGILTRQLTVFDNGQSIENMYDNKELVRVLQTDGSNIASWTTQNTGFAAGIRTDKFVTYDDGTTRDERYVDNVLREVIKVDASADGTARSWESFTLHLDAQGKLTSQLITYDTGIVREDTFVNGVRVSTIQQDNPDQPGPGVKDWTAITSTFSDAGTMVARHVVYDDSDVQLKLYDNAALVAQVDFDGDDDQTWAYQERVFGPEGSVQVINHADAATLPPQYHPYFGIVDSFEMSM